MSSSEEYSSEGEPVATEQPESDGGGAVESESDESEVDFTKVKVEQKLPGSPQLTVSPVPQNLIRDSESESLADSSRSRSNPTDDVEAAAVEEQQVVNTKTDSENDNDEADNDNVIGDLSSDESDSSAEEIVGGQNVIPKQKIPQAVVPMSSDEEVHGVDGRVDDDVEDERRDQEEDVDDDRDEEKAYVPPPAVRNTVKMPPMPRCDPKLDDQIYFTKLPNFLSIEPRPWDPETFEFDEESMVRDAEGRRRLKIKDENAIRWRYQYVKDRTTGETKRVRQSNSSIVKWSDGTMSLRVGDEVFNALTVDGPNGCDHLMVRQGPALVGQAVVRKRLIFRPLSFDSGTHQRLLVKIEEGDDRKRIKVASARYDPEAEKLAAERAAEEAERAGNRREARRRKMANRAMRTGASGRFLEDEAEEGDDGSLNLGAIKRKFQERTSNARKFGQRTVADNVNFEAELSDSTDDD